MVLLRYPGTKPGLEPLIPRGPFACWCEPFVGAGGMALAIAQRVHAGAERFVLGDRDYALVALWDCVLTGDRDFAELVEDFNPSLQTWDEQREVLKDSEASGATLGFAKLAVHQMSYSGLGEKAGGPIGGMTQNEKTWGIGCRWNPKALLAKFERARRLMAGRTTVVCAEWSETLDLAPEDATLYVDPPYFEVGESLYREQVDHAALAAHLEAEDREWWLSYDDCAPVRDLYGFAAITSVYLSYTIAKKRTQTELVISQGRPLAIKEQLTLDGA